MACIDIKYSELSNVLLSSEVKTVDVLLNYFKIKYNPSEDLQNSFRLKVSRYYMPSFTIKWFKVAALKRNKIEKFLEDNKNWLNSKLSMSEEPSSRTLRKF